MRKLTQEEVIDRFRKVHGDRYDYSLVEYKGNHKHVDVICKTCGLTFPITPSHHFNGRGCRRCAGCGHKTHDEFMFDVKKIWGDTFDYSLVEYVTDQTKIKVICKEHGVFDVTPNNHLRRRGCPSCAPNKKSNKEEFIEKSIEKHGLKYSYNNVVFVNDTTHVNVTCKKHGDFPVTPKNHKKGRGCPYCAEHGYNPNKTGYLYVIRTTEFVGFGITNSVELRMSQHDLQFKRNDIAYEAYHIISGNGLTIRQLESKIKRYFKKSIVDTKISGFRNEALPSEKLEELIEFITKEKPPEGG